MGLRNRTAPAVAIQTVAPARALSRTALARQVSAEIREAACDGMSVEWTVWEAMHDAAETSEEARAAASEAIAVCDVGVDGEGCPERARCALRAQLDGYTGLAAGGAWLNGRQVAIDHEQTSRRRSRRTAA